MTTLRIVQALLLSPAALLLSSCGGIPPPAVSGSCQAPASFSVPGCTGRCLASITVCPATADPHAAGGQVQFTATGNYSAPPYTVTPQPVTWGVCQNNTPTTAVTVSSTGLAQCGSTAGGAYTVFAFDGTNCNAITACGGGCTVRGVAQLTCP